MKEEMDIMEELRKTLPHPKKLKNKDIHPLISPKKLKSIEDLDITLQTLNLKDRVLVVTVPDAEYDFAAEMISEAHDSLIEAGCTFSIVVTSDTTLESIDEDKMAEHGWYKKETISAELEVTNG